jgi:signal transduction histidine kinase
MQHPDSESVASSSSNTLRGKLRWTIAFLALILGLLGIHRLALKASLPFEFQQMGSTVIAAENFGGQIHAGDQISTIDGISVSRDYQVEFLLDGKAVGASVRIGLVSGERAEFAVVQLVPAYSDHLFVITSLLIGIIFWGIALYVMVKKPDEKGPMLVFWNFMLFGLAIMASIGNYSEEPRIIGYLVRMAETISYSFGIATLIHFASRFPQQKWSRPRLFLFPVYFSAAVIAVGLTVTQVLAIANQSLSMLNIYQTWWWIHHVGLVLGIVSALLLLLHSYVTLHGEAERKKIQWILSGAAAGTSPFLFLRVVPNLFGAPGLVREETAMAFLFIIPVTFAIAVIKHHIFDIEIIIRRSVAYTLLTGLVVGVYFVIVVTGTWLLRAVSGESEQLVSLLAALGIAVLFNPARHRIRNFVDRTFYRVQYDFRETVRTLNSEIKEVASISQLGQLVIHWLDTLIPTERIALIIVTEPGHRMKVVVHRGFELAAKHIPALQVDRIASEMKLPVARPDKVEAGVVVDTGMVDVFERWGISLALPLTLQPRKIVGVIVLGDKRSGLKYSSFDVDLLITIASQTALAVERLQLQEKLILEEMEKKRLEELSALKSEFVSSVSHELRTPLTSIQMFAETLLTRKVKTQKKRDEYLGIIQGESERLTRLINNILDFAKIEKGIKQYALEPTDLKAVLEHVLKSMRYQFDKMKFHVSVRLPRSVPLIDADRDAVEEAVINLVSNAMKYSGKNRRIEIRLSRNQANLAVVVNDHGIGIPEVELPSIFEKFYRASEGSAKYAAGAGLGLALVKHIMDAHGGEVKVQSKVGKGSSFTLQFPIKRGLR